MGGAVGTGGAKLDASAGPDAGADSGGAGGTGGSGPDAGPAKSSAGCAQPPAAKGVINGMIVARGKMRSYVLSVPSSYAGNVPLSLVFMFHGGGNSGGGFRGGGNSEIPAAGRALFVYPSGLGGVWDLKEGGDDVLLIDALVADLGARYCLDLNRIFAAGFSYGGWMATAAGCQRGDVMRAIASVAGGGPQQTGCKERVGVWITHGAADGAENISEGRKSRDFYVNRNGCTAMTAAVDPAPCQANQGCPADGPVIFCGHAGGHEWPSFADAAIWKFFDSFK
jgi:poly(3-hydroxybutyrate) depolymerase